MTRILLVSPPFYRLWGSAYRGMNLGVSSLVATLRRAGHDAWQLNADFEPSNDYLPTRQIYLNASGQSDWKMPLWDLFRGTARAVAAFQPDVVGYSSFSANYGTVAAITPLVQQLCPSVVQIIGGPHATVDGKAASRIPAMRLRFVGEAEESLLRYLAGGNSIPGIGTPAHRLLNLDELPPVDRKHWWSLKGRPMDAGEKRYLNFAYISTARGCPYECAFCSAPKLWNRRVTYRGVASVLDEWEELAREWSPGRPEIHIIDDTFTFDKARALEIMAGIRERGLTAPWKCESRADAIDEEGADALVASGCKRVKIGFESGSEAILKRVRKRETKGRMRQTVRILKDRDIPITGYWIAGYPGETDEDLRKTIDFARELDLDTNSLNVFSPYPGSAFHDEMHGDWDYLIEKEPWKLFGQSRIKRCNPDLSEELLEEYWSLSGEQKHDGKSVQPEQDIPTPTSS